MESKEICIHGVLKHKLIAILRKVEPDKLLHVAEALYRGGIRLMEVTFVPSGAFPEELTLGQIESIRKSFGQELLAGAGTVLTSKQAELAHGAGASFIISPNTEEWVIKRTLELGMTSIPGALTPTEMQRAHELGADFVKLFPAGELGLAYIKGVMAPLNHIKTLAVGGIHENNMAAFLAAGVKGFGIGSNLVSGDLIKKGEYKELELLAARFAAKAMEGERL